MMLADTLPICVYITTAFINQKLINSDRNILVDAKLVDNT